MAVDLVLFGPPGAGKGTQGAKLALALDIAHLSTGAMLREAVRAGSNLGREVSGRLDSGKLVDDVVVDALVAQSLLSPTCSAGAVLDGYPRNLTQAASLDQNLARFGRKLRVALFIELPEADIVSRLRVRCAVSHRDEATRGRASTPAVRLWLRGDDARGGARRKWPARNPDSLLRRAAPVAVDGGRF